jgi:hypothetical protein
MSFLAGVATGVLLAQRMGRAGPMAAAQPLRRSAGLDRFASGGAAGFGSGPERDYPTHARPRTDDELRERICAQLARTVHDADAIQVQVSDGSVTLRGRVQARDVILVMAEVENTAGLGNVRNEMRVEGSLDDVAPPMTGDTPAVRAGEPASSSLS